MNSVCLCILKSACRSLFTRTEVVESDFSKLLSEGNAAEAMAVEEYEKLTQDNEIATTEKETAVKYKTKDSKETEAMLAGLKEDKEVASKEYSAIMDYWEQLQPMCIAKPEPYARAGVTNVCIGKLPTARSQYQS